MKKDTDNPKLTGFKKPARSNFKKGFKASNTGVSKKAASDDKIAGKPGLRRSTLFKTPSKYGSRGGFKKIKTAVSVTKSVVAKQKPGIKVRLLYAGPAAHLQNLVNQLASLCRSQKVSFAGPVHLPNVRMKLAVRRAPGGEGSGTYNHYYKELRKKLVWIGHLKVLAMLPAAVVQAVNIEVVTN